MGYTIWNILVVLDFINSGYSGKAFRVTEQATYIVKTNNNLQVE